MAAPTKQGLDYFPYEIGLLKDRKFRSVRQKYGAIVCIVYLAILELAYGDKGYYVEYEAHKDDVLWEITEYLRGRHQPDADTVSDVIDGLVESGLLSGDHYPKIITSKRLQATYYKATTDRKAVTVDFDVWLLSEEEMRKISVNSVILRDFINRSNNGVNRANNSVNRANNPQSKGKEIEERMNVDIDSPTQLRVCAGARARGSYEEIMDDLELEAIVRPICWEFIRHCQLNKHTLTDHKLEDILLYMDTHAMKPEEKIAALKTAINGGYYDIQRM